MLFGNKICEECGESYDKALANCPKCHQENKEFTNSKVTKKVVWLPLLQQILLFIVGNIGLSVISLAVQIILESTLGTDSTYFLPLTSTFSYLFVFIGLLAIIIKYFNCFKSSFNKIAPYLWGLLGGVVLIITSFAYSKIINLIHPMNENDNQSAVVDMITLLPITSIIVLGIIGPICEELTYRVGLFNFFLRIKPWVAYIVSILIFGLIHFNIRSKDIVNELLNLPSYMIAGGILSFFYHKFGLASSTTAHITNNLFSVIINIIRIRWQ